MSNKLNNSIELLRINSAIKSDIIAVSPDDNMIIYKLLEYNKEYISNTVAYSGLRSVLMVLQHKSNRFSECVFEALDIITSAYYNFYVKKLPISSISKLGRKLLTNITPFKMLEYIESILSFIRHSYTSDAITYNRQFNTFTIFLFYNGEDIVVDSNEIYDTTGCIKDNEYMSGERIRDIIYRYIDYIMIRCNIYIQKLIFSCFIYQISFTTGNNNNLRSNYLLINKGYNLKSNKSIINDFSYAINVLHIIYRDNSKYDDMFKIIDILCCSADGIPQDNNSSYYSDISKIESILEQRELSTMIDYKALTKDEYNNQLQAWSNLGVANHILIDKRHRLKLIRFNDIPYEVCFLDFKVQVVYGHAPILFILEYTDTTYTKVKNIIHLTQHIVDALDFNLEL